MRNVDVWWGVGNARQQQLVDSIPSGKKVMRDKLKAGEESIIMYAQHPTNDDDTISYFFKNGEIKSERL